jgi:hypothetical protein
MGRRWPTQDFDHPIVCGVDVAVEPGVGAESGAGRGHPDDQDSAGVPTRVPALQNDGTFEAGRSDPPQYAEHHRLPLG